MPRQTLAGSEGTRFDGERSTVCRYFLGMEEASGEHSLSQDLAHYVVVGVRDYCPRAKAPKDCRTE
jgi:hypothetical protein